MDKKATWDRFYTENQAERFKHFDWFFGYDVVSEFLLPFIRGKHSFSVLDVGCGTSDVGPGLYKHSATPVHVFCVDFSCVAVEHMRHQFLNLPKPKNCRSELHFMESDATELKEFQSQSFNLVLDKGTSDALLRASDGAKKASKVLLECLRVLKPHGNILQFSDEDPDARIPFLQQANKDSGQDLSIAVQELGSFRGVNYFMYIINLQDLGSVL
ncbi:citrate synthase-lysine N-methyltransferase CSKMT, mitochondrial isoform X2 [Protopterus annectens]|nr:citrate synthase-lysine N-methyltransferase CSKMT, mitochondrial isoform X2 [Protopterus annectens]XP_043931571.1 citrate synthase-lysine N-methyltransferase CSKMT, mitochondrial isoform X2 [Protopterus annectens]